MSTENRKKKIRKRERPLLDRVRTGVRRRAFILKKELYQRIKWPRGRRTAIAFIVGCQRSGTTLMTQLFDSNMATKVFGEFSRLSSADVQYGVRLNPLEQVERALSSVHAPIVVMKPLVETQRVHELLDYFDSSRAVFLYRDFHDVASSNLKKFGSGNGVRDLRPIIENDRTNWRSECLSDHVRQAICRHFSEDMSSGDAAALFWYARNQLFFDLELNRRDDVLLCRYESLVAQPAETMAEIYQFMNCSADGSGIAGNVHRDSVRKGRGLELSAEIEGLCQELLDRLNDAHDARNRVQV